MSGMILDDQEQSSSTQSKNSTWKDFKQLWIYVSPYTKPLKVGLVFFVFDLMANLSLPKLMGQLVDKGLKPPFQFQFYFVLFLLTFGCMLIFNVTQKFIFIRIGERALQNIRREVYELLQRVPLKFYDSNSSGKIISRTVNDVSALSVIFNAKFFSMVSDSIIIMGALVSLLIIRPMFGLAVIGVLACLIVFLVHFITMYSARMQKFRSMNSRLNSFVADTMNGLEIIFSGQYQRFWFPRARRFVKLFKLSAENVILGWAQFPMAHTFSLGIVYALFILLCGPELKTGAMTGGQFLSILTYILYIFNPFFEISQKISEFQAAMTSMAKINQILSLRDRLEGDYDHGEELKNPSGSIAFHSLYFGYDQNNDLFKNLNITIPGEKITALIGRTGSGKTSFISIVSRLYPYLRGNIKIGDQELSSVGRNSLYAHLGIVTQQLFLFDDCLRENLRLFDSKKSDAQIWEVLRDVQIEEKVKSLPRGLDTIYEKNNDPFSVGEKQLLIIARMLLKNPRILIFDEATASLDNHSEYLVQMAMRKLFQGRTTIIIAHRLSTIELAENIVVLESGRVIQHGDPNVLRLSDGPYANYLKFIAHSTT